MTKFRYLSLGAGVQSSALYILACQGAYENGPEVAIFADTQAEPPWVYEQLDRLEAWGSIPIERVTGGSLESDSMTTDKGHGGGFARMPAFTLGDDGRAAPLRRQCTREYKITPIERHVRALLGLKKGQRAKRLSECHLGISTDEMRRMRASRTRWIENRWPLVELGLNREGCRRVVTDAGFPEPEKSACVFCPYHSDAYWDWMKRTHPDQFARAVAMDERIRDLTGAGVKRPAFLHRSLRPLAEVEFINPRQGVLDFDGCESGHCGV